MTKADIIIIGGGAAGFFAAISCAEANPNLKVIILEKGKDVLAKVRISGGGRCNLTHACFEPRELIKNYPRGAKALLGPFNQFCSGDTIDWYAKKNVETKIESDGRMFPISDSSQSIIDCLWNAATAAGVSVIKHTNVQSIKINQEHEFVFRIYAKDNIAYHSKKLMIATGSSPRFWDLLSSLGHRIVPPVPSLFTFNIKDKRIKELPGLSVANAHVKILKTKLEATGPLLITHWGMSGPGILKLSAWGARILNEMNYQFTLKVNWLGHQSAEETKEHFNQLKNTHPKKIISSNQQFAIPSRLWKKLVAASGIPDDLRWLDISKKALNRLVEQLTNAQFEVNGKSTFKEEFVTAGGVNLKEVNFKRFESKIHPKLFFAGEVLNIDAITGGFNFQAAWTGGWIAGHAMAISE